MQYVHGYFALLREAYDDIVNTFESDTARGFVVGSLVLIPIFGTLFFFAVLVNAAAPTPETESAALTLTQRDPQTVTVDLRNNLYPLNTAEIEIYFDPEHFSVTDVAIEPVLCEERFVITNLIDNNAGRMFYQCGTISPFAGTSTTLATITLQPKTGGTSTVALGRDSNVLAHDGLGTNVTGTRGTTTVTTAG